MAGTTLVHHSSISYFQDQDIQGRLHSGRSHLIDDPGIIIRINLFLHIRKIIEYSESTINVYPLLSQEL